MPSSLDARALPRLHAGARVREPLRRHPPALPIAGGWGSAMPPPGSISRPPFRACPYGRGRGRPGIATALPPPGVGGSEVQAHPYQTDARAENSCRQDRKTGFPAPALGQHYMKLDTPPLELAQEWEPDKSGLFIAPRRRVRGSATPGPPRVNGASTLPGLMFTARPAEFVDQYARARARGAP